MFAAHYVLCGGNATKAAALAGYASPCTSSRKNLVNPTVLAEIKRLSVINISAYLPSLVRTALEMAFDPETPPIARVQILRDLMDRGGMAVPKNAPMVAVQVNVDGNQAQAIIREVHDSRVKRLSAPENGE